MARTVADSSGAVEPGCTLGRRSALLVDDRSRACEARRGDARRHVALRLLSHTDARQPHTAAFFRLLHRMRSQKDSPLLRQPALAEDARGGR